jgi:hypothetical protein
MRAPDPMILMSRENSPTPKIDAAELIRASSRDPNAQ